MAWMLRRARTDLSEVNRDPLSYKVPSEVYLSKDYQRLVAKILQESKPRIDLTKDLELKTSKAAVKSSGLEPTMEVEDSCHNVVVDPEGNWVSMLHNSHGGGIPGLVVDGVKLGGMSNHAVCSGPGRRRRSAICPVMVLNDDNEPWMSLGTPGIPSLSTSIVLTNIFEFGMDPNNAASAPRFWGLKDEVKKGLIYTVDVENRISDNAVSELAKLGVQINPLGPYRWNMGSFQIVWKDIKTGMLKGTSDPRRLGHAEGF
jgi:gamma-glutamyltranspeptidase